MDLGLTGKRALILGGSGGLGFATAKCLAAEGVAVGLVGRDPSRIAAAVADLHGRGLAAVGIAYDLSGPDRVDRLLDVVERDLGPPDILLLNGGGPPASLAVTLDAPLWHGQLDAMLLAGIAVAQHCLIGMRRRRWGRILVVGSTSVREPIAGLTLSNALRAAVAGWAKTLAGEVAGDGVTVNMLLPGRLMTDRTRRLDQLAADERGLDASDVAAESQAEIPLGRYGDPDEFGATAAFLASRHAAYVTGVAIPVDGGVCRTMI